MGTFVELYDFGLYGFAAALVFGKVFFPSLGTSAGTLAAFATLGVAFVARPFGAIIFGHFGDRIGRKVTLIATLLIMGVATALVGVLPTAESIGIAAPIILVILRILQGLAAGGEWAGAVLFTAENAPKARRGFWAMFASLGGGIAITLAPITFLAVGGVMSDEAFMSYGWRLPFLFSALLVAIGLWIRITTSETKAFKTQITHGGAAKIPFLEAFTRQPRELLLGTGLFIVISSFGYLGASFLISYGTTQLAFDRNFVLLVGAVGGLGYTIAIAISAILSDRVGRRRIVIIATISGIVWALLLFPLIDNAGQLGFGVGLFGAMFISGFAAGPMSALLSELFNTRYRYTAAALCYSFANIIGGAVAPFVAVAIAANYNGIVVGVFMAALALISLVSALIVKETSSRDLEDVATLVPAA